MINTKIYILTSNASMGEKIMLMLILKKGWGNPCLINLNLAGQKNVKLEYKYIFKFTTSEL